MDTHKLRIAVSNMKNTNTRETLDRIKTQVLANLAQLPPVPSVPLAPRPPKTELPDAPEPDMDVRGGGQAYDDGRVAPEADYATDDEEVQPARDPVPQVRTETVCVCWWGRFCFGDRKRDGRDGERGEVLRSSLLVCHWLPAHTLPGNGCRPTPFSARPCGGRPTRRGPCLTTPSAQPS